jgi:hypothetical protein
MDGGSAVEAYDIEVVCMEGGGVGAAGIGGRGFHSSTLQLNLSRFCH